MNLFHIRRKDPFDSLVKLWEMEKNDLKEITIPNRNGDSRLQNNTIIFITNKDYRKKHQHQN